MSPQARRVRMLDAGQRLANGQLWPAMFREIMDGQADCGMWLRAHKQSAEAWLVNISGCPGATLAELRTHVAEARRQAALN